LASAGAVAASAANPATKSSVLMAGIMNEAAERSLTGPDAGTHGPARPFFPHPKKEE
jgi:hypothetical protein